MNEKIFEQIKLLPPLPESVIKIKKIASDPDSSWADLVPIIESDPMLKANLLKAANSPLYGFRRKINSVELAVSLFGKNTVKGFAISFAVRNSLKFDLSAYGISSGQFQDISSKRNAIAFNWFRKDLRKLDILGTNSFLMEIGAVIISLVLNNENESENFRQRLEAGEDRDEIEREFVGATTVEVTAEIFKHWNFSEDLVDSLKNIYSPKAPYEVESAALWVLRLLVDMLKPFDKEYEQKAFEVAKKYSLNIEALELAVEIVKG